MISLGKGEVQSSRLCGSIIQLIVFVPSWEFSYQPSGDRNSQVTAEHDDNRRGIGGDFVPHMIAPCYKLVARRSAPNALSGPNHNRL